MGYIEETGAAQYLRDARITTIYEGTTGIQANDLVGRKIGRDRGAALMAAIADLRETVPALAATGRRESRRHRHAPRTPASMPSEGARAACRRVDAHAIRARVLAGAVPFLELAGIVFGGGQLARARARGRERTCGRTGRRRFPAREDRDRASLRGSLPHPGLRLRAKP